MARVLITGGSGLLALNWAYRMRTTHEIVLAQHSRRVVLRGTRSIMLPLEPLAELTRELEQIAPDFVVHTAGLTSVDQCEQQPDLALHLNAALARNVADATHRLGIKLVHISTDHVFGGDAPLYKETDRPDPLNVYARTKLQAEEWVQQSNPQALVARTNFFGWGHRYRQSMSDWIIASLRNGRMLSMYEDVFFTPLLADHLADAIHRALATAPAGVYHFAGDERLSKYEFALRLTQVFELPDSLIQRANISASHGSTRRPRDMSLDNARVRTLLAAPLGSVDTFLRALRAQEIDGRAGELMNSVLE